MMRWMARPRFWRPANEDGIKVETSPVLERKPLLPYFRQVVSSARQSSTLSWSDFRDASAQSGALEGLRGIAALSVFQQHRLIEKSMMHGFGESGQHYYFCSLPFVRLFTNGGAAAMTVLFVLSGYYLSQSTIKHLGTTGRQAAVRGLWTSAIKRPFRLYLPALVVGLIVALLMQLPYNLWPSMSWGWPQPSLTQEMNNWLWVSARYFNPFQTHAWTAGTYQYAWQVWSIPVQLKGSWWLYLLLGAVVGLSLSPLAAFIALSTLVVILLQRGWWSLACIIGGSCLALLQAFDIDGEFLFGHMGKKARRISMMAIAIAGVHLLSQPRFEYNLAASLETPGWHYLTRMIPKVYDDQRYYRFWHTYGSILLIWMVFRVEGLQRALDNRVLRFVGKRSLMLYLLHPALKYSLFEPYLHRILAIAPPSDPPQWWDSLFKLPDYGPTGATLPITAEWLVSLVITLFFAHLGTRCIDKPCTKVGNYISRHLIKSIDHSGRHVRKLSIYRR